MTPNPPDSNHDAVDAAIAPIELDDNDLEDISGGIDIFFSSSMFQRRDRASSSSRRRRRRRNQSSEVNSSAFQFMGLGFNSASDVMAVLEGLSKFFHR